MQTLKRILNIKYFKSVMNATKLKKYSFHMKN